MRSIEAIRPSPGSDFTLSLARLHLLVFAGSTVCMNRSRARTSTSTRMDCRPLGLPGSSTTA